MNDGNVIADFDSELRGAGSTAKVNVVAISLVNKFKELIQE